jgi:hypothetical protein
LLTDRRTVSASNKRFKSADLSIISLYSALFFLSRDICGAHLRYSFFRIDVFLRISFNWALSKGMSMRILSSSLIWLRFTIGIAIAKVSRTAKFTANNVIITKDTV